MDDVSDQLNFILFCLLLCGVFAVVATLYSWIHENIIYPAMSTSNEAKYLIGKTDNEYELITLIESFDGEDFKEKDYIDAAIMRTNYFGTKRIHDSRYFELRGILSYLSGDIEKSEIFFNKAIVTNHNYKFVSQLANSWLLQRELVKHRT